MFSLVFSLILGPAIVAFLLGLSAHALKQMTASLETEANDEGSPRRSNPGPR